MGTEYSTLKQSVDESFDRVCKTPKEFGEYNSSLRKTIGKAYHTAIEQLIERCVDELWNDAVEIVDREIEHLTKENEKFRSEEYTNRYRKTQQGRLRLVALNDAKVNWKNTVSHLKLIDINVGDVEGEIEEQIEDQIYKVKNSLEDINFSPENWIRKNEEKIDELISSKSTYSYSKRKLVLRHFRTKLMEKLDSYQEWFDLGKLIVDKYNTMPFRQVPDEHVIKTSFTDKVYSLSFRRDQYEPVIKLEVEVSGNIRIYESPGTWSTKPYKRVISWD